MRVAIISDVHNNTTNLKKVLDYCARNMVEKIICCGDLASMETLDFLNDNFSGEIFYCFGNMDDDFLTSTLLEIDKQSDVIPAQAGIQKNLLDSGSEAGMTIEYKNTKIYKNFGEAEFGSSASKKYRVAFVHYPNVARELAEIGKYDFVFYGHTHKPWEENINGCKMLNPGNVAGEIYPPTFAVWDMEGDKFELIRIHNLK